MVAHPELIAGMRNVKDSYNCDAVSLAGGAAAIRDVDYAVEVTKRIRTSRERMTSKLRELGFDCVDSQANFIWTEHPTGEHDRIYAALKEARILVRNMKYPDANGRSVEGLRMSVGSEDECERLLEVVARVV